MTLGRGRRSTRGPSSHDEESNTDVQQNQQQQQQSDKQEQQHQEEAVAPPARNLRRVPPPNLEAAADKEGERERTNDSSLTRSLRSYFDGIYDLKDENGDNISEVFHALPERKLTEYFKTIKRPMSLFMIRKDLNKNRYTSPQEFIYDLAQITWNCRLFNRKNSIFYTYALILDDYLKAIIKKMQNSAKFKNENLQYPDLGELPENDGDDEEEEDENAQVEEDEIPKRKRVGRPSKAQQQEEEEEEDENEDEDEEEEEEDDEEDDDEDEEEDEDDDDEDDGSMRKRKTRALKNRSSKKKKVEETSATSTPAPEDRRKKRGRPPTVDKPHEHRIKAIMRGVRKVKDENTRRMLHLEFEKLPDPKVNPEYYQVIKMPLGMDNIRKNIKRRKYGNVEVYLDDMKQMFANARIYNGPQSQMGIDANKLENRMLQLAKEEMSKPDSVYQDPESNSKISRLPLDSVDHEGTIYRVGDWIHIKNPNNPKSPTVGQIFRIWRNANNQQWINVCWYYRPEQTVHKYDKLFFENEVVKSGQYRDHRVDEILEKCFVMFFTKYQRGRPRGIGNASVYCCESRYNENEKTFNKIRTWKACIPDEVRSTDYPMDLFDRVIPLRRVPSPIKHLLPANARDNDPIPEPAMGAPNAPPAIGAVYRRPYDPDDPPEVPTPANADTPRIVTSTSSPTQHQNVAVVNRAQNYSNNNNNAHNNSHNNNQNTHHNHTSSSTSSYNNNTVSGNINNNAHNNSTQQNQIPTQQHQGKVLPPQQPMTQQYILTNGMRYTPTPQGSSDSKDNSQVNSQLVIGPNGLPMPVNLASVPGTPGAKLQQSQSSSGSSSANEQALQGPIMGQLMPNVSYAQQHPNVGFNPQAAAPSPLPAYLANICPPGQQIPAATAVAQQINPPAGAATNYVPSPVTQQQQQPISSILPGMSPVAPGVLPAPGPPNPVPYIQMPLGATSGAFYNPQQYAQAGINPPPSGPSIVQPMVSPMPNTISPVSSQIVPPPHLAQTSTKEKAHQSDNRLFDSSGVPVQLQHIPRQQYPQYAQKQALLQQQHLQQQLQNMQQQLSHNQQAQLQQQLHLQLQQHQQQAQQRSSSLGSLSSSANASASGQYQSNQRPTPSASGMVSGGSVVANNAVGALSNSTISAAAAAAAAAGGSPITDISSMLLMAGSTGTEDSMALQGDGGVGTSGLQPISTPGVAPTTNSTIAITTRDGQSVIPTAVALLETDATSDTPGLSLKYPTNAPLAKVTVKVGNTKAINGAGNAYGSGVNLNGLAADSTNGGSVVPPVDVGGPENRETVAWFPTPPVFIPNRRVCNSVGRNISGLLFEQAGVNGNALNTEIADNANQSVTASQDGDLNGANGTNGNGTRSNVSKPAIGNIGIKDRLADEQRNSVVVGHSAKYLAWKRQKLASKSAGKPAVGVSV